MQGHIPSFAFAAALVVSSAAHASTQGEGAPASTDPVDYEVTLDLSKGQGTFTEHLLLSESRLVETVAGAVVPVRGLRIGDVVVLNDGQAGGVTGLRRQEAGPTAPDRARRVVGVSRVVTHDLITLSTGNDTLQASPEHRFAVQGRGWIAAANLRVGDKVLTSSVGQTVELRAISSWHGEPTVVFNLLVEGTHTFHVGKDALLVHNGSCVVSPAVVSMTPRPGMPRPTPASGNTARLTERRPPLPGARPNAPESLPSVPFRRNPDVPRPDTIEFSAVDFDKLGTGPSRPRLAGIDNVDAAVATAHPIRAYPDGTGAYLGSDGVVRHIMYSPDPANAIDRANIDQLMHNAGLPSPKSSLVTANGRTGYAMEVTPPPKKGAPPAPIMRPGATTSEMTSFHPGGPAETNTAYTFVSRKAVPLGGYNAGHLAWGFEYRDPVTGKKGFVAGSVENVAPTAIPPHHKKGVWRGVFDSEEDMLEEVSRRGTWSGYTSYRSTSKTQTPGEMQEGLQGALGQTEMSAAKPYALCGSNCLDHSHDVLKGGNFLPKGASPHNPTTMFPNSYFDKALGPSGDAWGPEEILPQKKKP